MTSTARAPDYDRVLGDVLAHATANLRSIHGLAHWARVERNGVWLAGRCAADVSVVRLFALLHDAMRVNDWHDPDHGPRAANLATSLGPERLGITVAALDLLCRACDGHTRGRTAGDPTVGACWDADRLDLPRAGITPRPRFFSTRAARALVVAGDLAPVESIRPRELG